MSLRDQATNQLPQVHPTASPADDTSYERARSEPAAQRRWPGRLLDNYRAHGGEGLAAAVAFNALIALAPLAMLLFLTMSFLVQFSVLRDLTDNILNTFLSASDVDSTLDFIESGQDNAGGIGVVMIVGLIYGGRRLFSGLNQALAATYQTSGRATLRQNLAGMVMAPAVALMLLLSAAAAAGTTMAFMLPSYFSSDGSASWPAGIVGYLIAFIVTLLVGSAIYSVFPQSRPAETVGPGALLFAIGFSLLSQVFPLFVWLASGSDPYASIPALIIVILVWLYLTGQCIILGAEFNAMLSDRNDDTPVTTSHRATIDASPESGRSRSRTSR